MDAKKFETGSTFILPSHNRDMCSNNNHKDLLYNEKLSFFFKITYSALPAENKQEATLLDE